MDRENTAMSRRTDDDLQSELTELKSRLAVLQESQSRRVADFSRPTDSPEEMDNGHDPEIEDGGEDIKGEQAEVESQETERGAGDKSRSPIDSFINFLKNLFGVDTDKENAEKIKIIEESLVKECNGDQDSNNVARSCTQALKIQGIYEEAKGKLKEVVSKMYPDAEGAGHLDGIVDSIFKGNDFVDFEKEGCATVTYDHGRTDDPDSNISKLLAGDNEIFSNMQNATASVVADMNDDLDAAQDALSQRLAELRSTDEAGLGNEYGMSQEEEQQEAFSIGARIAKINAEIEARKELGSPEDILSTSFFGEEDDKAQDTEGQASRDKGGAGAEQSSEDGEMSWVERLSKTGDKAPSQENDGR
jgi:hypothetical protein